MCNLRVGRVEGTQRRLAVFKDLSTQNSNLPLPPSTLSCVFNGAPRGGVSRLAVPPTVRATGLKPGEMLAAHPASISWATAPAADRSSVQRCRKLCTSC